MTTPTPGRLRLDCRHCDANTYDHVFYLECYMSHGDVRFIDEKSRPAFAAALRRAETCPDYEEEETDG